MAQPTEYDRQTSFSLFSSEFPGEPHSGADLDTEFNAVKVSLDETQANLALIQRDDGTLAAGSVGLDQLNESISIGVTAQGVWETARAYTADTNVVFHTTKLYLCMEDHTSGTFATDLAAEKWLEIADLGVQVLDDDTVGPAELQDDAVETAKIQNSAVTNAKLATGTIELAKLAATLQEYLVPAGAILPYGGVTEPTGWLWANGRVVAQATYPATYAVFGTKFNTGGEGAGNFRLPDLCGRNPTGSLNMGGGTPIDTTTYGTDPSVVGALGGVKNTTLVTGNIPQFTPAGTVAITDPTHATTLNNGGTVLKLGGANSANVTHGGGVDEAVTITANAAATGITAAFTGTAFGSASPTAISRIAPAIALNYIVKMH